MYVCYLCVFLTAHIHKIVIHLYKKESGRNVGRGVGYTAPALIPGNL